MLLGLDISTSCIGIAIFDEKYKLHELSYVKFTKGKTMFEKIDEFILYFKKYDEIQFTEISIEEPLKRFAGKFSNAETIQKLTQMNAMISAYLYLKLNVTPVYYNVLHARKVAFPNLIIPKSHPSKKTLIWECVMRMEPTINWVYSKKTGKLADETYDMCDAYTISLAHITSQISNKNKILSED